MTPARITISTRALLVLMVVLAVLPGVAVVVYGYVSAQRQALKQVQLELESVAALAAANQESVVQGVRQILGTVASGPSVRRDDLRPLCREFLRNIVIASPGYSNIGLANLQGEVICHGHANNAVLNVADQRYFQNVIATSEFAVGRYTTGRITGQSVLGFGLPVYDYSNKRVGVAFATMDLTLANQRLREVALPAYLQVHLLDAGDTVLVSSGEGSLPVGTVVQDSGLREALRQSGGSIRERRDAAGDVWLDRVGVIGKDAGRSLRIAVSARQSDILAPAQARLREQLASLAVAALLGALMAGWVSESQFTRPVSHLLRRMRNAASAGGRPADETALRSANRELLELDTEFGRTLQTLRSQQEQLLKAQTIARVGFYALDVTQQRYTVSSIVYEIFGLDPAKGFIGLDEYTAMIHPDDLPMVLERRARLMQDHQPLRLQYRILRPDGELRWIDIFGFIEQAQEGRAVVYTGAVQDITERKRADQRLQSQLARTQLLGVITRAVEERLDLRGVFQVLTDSLQTQLPTTFCAVALRSHAEALEVQMESIGSGSEALAAAMSLSLGVRVPANANGLSRCLRGELVYEPEMAGLDFELPRRLTAGGLHSAVLAPLAMDGEVFGLIMVARAEPAAFNSGDCEFLHQLSEHVALAAHQARLYEDLQQAYEQLQRSQQVVLQQERLRALGQMASGVAHDINNAVSPVALYTEALLDTEPDLSERTRRYLLTIQRAIDDVSHTVTRMREFSRERDPTAGLMAVQFNALVPQVLELTRARWRDMPQQAGVTIEVDSLLEPDLPTVLATEGEIREALTNLVFNAVDAMPQGGRLQLGTSRHTGADGQPEVALFITDTGLGMDETTRRRCLEPFFTTKGERGTGLGLAMVYGTAQRHGGRIEIDSALGQGTTVRMLFPVQAPAVALALMPAPEPAPALALLLVDDDALLLDSLGEILRGEGHQVQAALGGQAGIDALRQAKQTGQRFDVVITDLGMPHVDGAQVAREAKALNPATPVVMLTGWGRRMSEDDEHPEHVDLLLSKPPRLAELRDMARRFAAAPTGALR